jgi:hypothetical protein
VEFYNIFLKKEKKRYIKKNKLEEDNEDDDSDMDYSELLTDENIEKFLRDCKIKFKDNVKSFYQLLINNGENAEDLFPEDFEYLTQKRTQEEIDQLLEERIKDKYFKNLAKYIIASKLQKKKIKKYITKNQNYDDDINEEDSDNSELIIEEEVEIEEEDINEIVSISLEEKFYNFICNFILYIIDLIFSYFTLVLVLLFITHMEKNIFIVSCFYVLNFLLLMKVHYFIIFIFNYNLLFYFFLNLFTLRTSMFLMKIKIHLSFS